jgi:hypothetical protein
MVKTMAATIQISRCSRFIQAGRAMATPSPGRPQPAPPGHGRLFGLELGQGKPLGLLAPLVPLAPQVGNGLITPLP